MGAFVEKIQFLGVKAIKAGNEFLEFIVVPEWGSNLISLVDQATETELLRVPATLEEYLKVPMLYGTPILFPPNRIENGSFTYEGKSYQFDINEVDKQNHSHGFVHDKQWKLLKAEVCGGNVEIVTEFDSSHFPNVMRQFPHHFILRVSYLLRDHVLTTHAEVKNQSDSRMPLGFGYHTTFLFPQESAFLYLQADKRWVLNERMLPIGDFDEPAVIGKLIKGTDLKDEILDDVFLAAPKEEGGHEVKISYPSEGLDVIYQTDESFKHWVVFNMDGEHGFICPEPYTWVTNAPNIKLSPSITGLVGLESGETKTVSTRISVFHNRDSIK